MAGSNQLELSVEVDTTKANSNIQGFNSNLNSMEQAAARAAKSSSSGFEGMTQSMLGAVTAGTLLADGIMGVVGALKDYISTSAMLAARNETLAVINTQLGRINDLGADSIERLVERMKALGITTQSSRDAVNQMMEAQLDLSKATQLARLSQDAAVIAGENSSAALTGIVHGITTQQVRVLRTYGIYVDFARIFEEAKIKLNRDLTDSERKNIAFQEVLKKAPLIAGSYEASLGSVGKQMTSLARFAEEASAAIGTEFLPQLAAMVKALTEAAKWAQENARGIADFAKGVALFAGTLATYAIAEKLMGMTRAMLAFNAASIATPWGVIAAAASVAGYAIYTSWEKSTDQMQKFGEEQKRAVIRSKILSGEMSMEAAKQQGYSAAQLRDIIGGKKFTGDDANKALEDAKAFQNRIKNIQSKELEDVRKMEALVLGREIAKKQVEIKKQAGEDLIKAGEAVTDAYRQQAKEWASQSLEMIKTTDDETEAVRRSLDVQFFSMQEHAAGVKKIRDEERLEIQKQSSFIDPKGRLQTFQIGGEALDLIHQATAQKIQAFDIKFNQEEAKRIEEIWKALGARIAKNIKEQAFDPIERNLEFWQSLRDLGNRQTDNQLSYQKAGIDQRKNLELAQLDAVDAVTIRQKIAVEQRKTEIEVDAIKRRTDVEMIEIDRRTEYEIRAAQRALTSWGVQRQIQEAEIAAKVGLIGKEERDALSAASANEIAVTQAKGAAQTRQIVVSEYRGIFDSLKSQAGGVFDALLTKSQSVWAALGNTFKTAMLTAIKDVVTSQIAVQLMNLFVPGSNAHMSQSGIGGGIFGGVGKMLGIGSKVEFGKSDQPNHIGDLQLFKGAAPVWIVNGGSGQGSGLESAAATASLAGFAGMLLGSGGRAAATGAGPGIVSSTIDYGGGAASTGAGVLSGGSGGWGGWGGGTFAGAGGAPGGGGAGGAAGMLGGLAGLKSLFGIGGSVATGAGSATTWGAATLGQKAGSIFSSTGAALVGGGLAFDGLRRGGFTGLAETIGGGALIGLKFGGPIGALIGAGVGAVAGTIRLFVKGAEEKLKSKIKEVYGIDVSDKDFLKSVLDLAKSGYGGNLDLAIRSSQVRDWLMYYKMQTGQGTGGALGAIDNTARGVSLSGYGGSVSQNAVNVGNGAYSYGGAIAAAPGSQSFQPNPTQTYLTLQIDGRDVNASVIQTNTASSGRRESAAILLDPLLTYG